MPVNHERFDPARWTREFGLAPLAEAARKWAGEVAASPPDNPEEPGFNRDIPMIIDGPRGMAVIEQIRAGLGDLGKADPTDVLIWALGEPANPAQTKIGGVPYRPTDKPWPQRPDGKPMGFLAQFCFADSRDLSFIPGSLLRRPRPLPGDCLLVFAPGEYLVDWDDDQPGSLSFEWHSLGIRNPMAAAEVPPAPLTLTPCHAQIHRTADYPEPPDRHPVFSLHSGKRVCILKGSKIGGTPAWEHGRVSLPGRHLCTLGSLNPFGEQYPLLNVPKNVAGNSYLPEKLLMLADVGLLYLFIDGKGSIRWTVQFG